MSSAFEEGAQQSSLHSHQIVLGPAAGEHSPPPAPTRTESLISHSMLCGTHCHRDVASADSKPNQDMWICCAKLTCSCQDISPTNSKKLLPCCCWMPPAVASSAKTCQYKLVQQHQCRRGFCWSIGIAGRIWGHGITHPLQDASYSPVRAWWLWLWRWDFSVETVLFLRSPFGKKAAQLRQNGVGEIYRDVTINHWKSQERWRLA